MDSFDDFVPTDISTDLDYLASIVSDEAEMGQDSNETDGSKMAELEAFEFDDETFELEDIQLIECAPNPATSQQNISKPMKAKKFHRPDSAGHSSTEFRFGAPPPRALQLNLHHPGLQRARQAQLEVTKDHQENKDGSQQEQAVSENQVGRAASPGCIRISDDESGVDSDESKLECDVSAAMDGNVTRFADMPASTLHPSPTEQNKHQGHDAVITAKIAASSATSSKATIVTAISTCAPEAELNLGRAQAEKYKTRQVQVSPTPQGPQPLAPDNPKSLRISLCSSGVDSASGNHQNGSQKGHSHLLASPITRQTDIEPLKISEITEGPHPRQVADAQQNLSPDSTGQSPGLRRLESREPCEFKPIPASVPKRAKQAKKRQVNISQGKDPLRTLRGDVRVSKPQVTQPKPSASFDDGPSADEVFDLFLFKRQQEKDWARQAEELMMDYQNEVDALKGENQQLLAKVDTVTSELQGRKDEHAASKVRLTAKVKRFEEYLTGLTNDHTSLARSAKGIRKQQSDLSLVKEEITAAISNAKQSFQAGESQQKVFIAVLSQQCISQQEQLLESQDNHHQDQQLFKEGLQRAAEVGTNIVQLQNAAAVLRQDMTSHHGSIMTELTRVQEAGAGRISTELQGVQSQLGQIQQGVAKLQNESTSDKTNQVADLDSNLRYYAEAIGAALSKTAQASSMEELTEAIGRIQSGLQDLVVKFNREPELNAQLAEVQRTKDGLQEQVYEKQAMLQVSQKQIELMTSQVASIMSDFNQLKASHAHLQANPPDNPILRQQLTDVSRREDALRQEFSTKTVGFDDDRKRLYDEKRQLNINFENLKDELVLVRAAAQKTDLEQRASFQTQIQEQIVEACQAARAELESKHAHVNRGLTDKLAAASVRQQQVEIKHGQDSETARRTHEDLKRQLDAARDEAKRSGTSATALLASANAQRDASMKKGESLQKQLKDVEERFQEINSARTNMFSDRLALVRQCQLNSTEIDQLRLQLQRAADEADAFRLELERTCEEDVLEAVADARQQRMDVLTRLNQTIQTVDTDAQWQDCIEEALDALSSLVITPKDKNNVIQILSDASESADLDEQYLANRGLKEDQIDTQPELLFDLDDLEDLAADKENMAVPPDDGGRVQSSFWAMPHRQGLSTNGSPGVVVEESQETTTRRTTRRTVSRGGGGSPPGGTHVPGSITTCPVHTPTTVNKAPSLETIQALTSPIGNTRDLFPPTSSASSAARFHPSNTSAPRALIISNAAPETPNIGRSVSMARTPSQTPQSRGILKRPQFKRLAEDNGDLNGARVKRRVSRRESQDLGPTITTPKHGNNKPKATRKQTKGNGQGSQDKFTRRFSGVLGAGNQG